MLGAVFGRRPEKRLEALLREPAIDDPLPGMRAKLIEGRMNRETMLRVVRMESVSLSRCGDLVDISRSIGSSREPVVGDPGPEEPLCDRGRTQVNRVGSCGRSITSTGKCEGAWMTGGDGKWSCERAKKSASYQYLTAPLHLGSICTSKQRTSMSTVLRKDLISGPPHFVVERWTSQRSPSAVPGTTKV